MKTSIAKAIDAARAWWFNPQNDLALAADTPYYTAPRAAFELAKAGELLPAWLSDGNDVIISSGVNDRWLNELSAKMGITVNLWNRTTRDFRPEPWGWSTAARTFFVHSGFDKELCPTDSQLKRFRELSGRAYAQTLDSIIFPDQYKKRVVRSEDDIANFLAETNGIVVKTPWSCSGRGVTFFDSQHFTEASKRIKSIIKSYGYTTVEPMMANPFEFGLLFYFDGKKADFQGLSRTVSASAGKYAGNIIATQSEHRAVIDHEAGKTGFTEGLIHKCSQAISMIFSSEYVGPIGLDFLISQRNIHLSEHNLRYTMGFVANGLSVKSGVTGVLSVKEANHKPVDGEICLTTPGTQLQFIIS